MFGAAKNDETSAQAHVADHAPRAHTKRIGDAKIDACARDDRTRAASGRDRLLMSP
jgi:hypothetical protein